MTQETPAGQIQGEEEDIANMDGNSNKTEELWFPKKEEELVAAEPDAAAFDAISVAPIHDEEIPADTVQEKATAISAAVEGLFGDDFFPVLEEQPVEENAVVLQEPLEELPDASGEEPHGEQQDHEEEPVMDEAAHDEERVSDNTFEDEPMTAEDLFGTSEPASESLSYLFADDESEEMQAEFAEFVEEFSDEDDEQASDPLEVVVYEGGEDGGEYTYDEEEVAPTDRMMPLKKGVLAVIIGVVAAALVSGIAVFAIQKSGEAKRIEALTADYKVQIAELEAANDQMRQEIDQLQTDKTQMKETMEKISDLVDESLSKLEDGSLDGQKGIVKSANANEE